MAQYVYVYQHSKFHAIASRVEHKIMHTYTVDFQNKETFGTPIFSCMNHCLS